MPDKEIGKVTHWYNNIGVAVIKLNSGLKLKDRIAVKRGDEEFEATVDSMQIEHQEIEQGRKGDEVAIKLPQKAKAGATISLLE